MKSLGKNSRVVVVTLLPRHLHDFVTTDDDSILSRQVSMNYEFGQAVVTNTSVNPRISGRMTD